MYDTNEQPPTKPILTSVDQLSVEALLQLRAEIETLLPATRLEDMNLEKELVIQYQQVKVLQEKVLKDNFAEPQHKAQIINSCKGALQELVTMQTKFHTAERLKNIESRLIKSLDKVPRKYLEEFFKYYESIEA